MLALIAFTACASAGSEPDASIQPANIDAPFASACGNAVIETGEDCDGANLGGASCEGLGQGQGAVSCSISCRYDTTSCIRCGDGAIGDTEQCDGAELGGVTCQSLGFLGGTMACDPAACTLDSSSCVSIEMLQNHNGVCAAEFGCSSNDGSGTSGNPQSLVECFNRALLTPPFYLKNLTYAVGTSTPAPDGLNLEVYTWSGSGVPGTRATTVALGPADRTSGVHTITLATPIEITTPDFCIGIGGTIPDDGYRLQFSTTSTTAGASWFDATTCGTVGFASMDSVVGPGNWCMSAVIDKRP